ncbi:MAG: hypothetical protein ABEH40_08480 [Haloferacaceae archaeon]
MRGDDPDPRNPLGPYYPSELPDVPANGRRWVAVLLSAALLLGAAYGLLSVLLAA